MPNHPIVALESTVISHGLPYPHNLRLALRLEAIVREAGAAPATVGIIAGEIVVGLSRGQIEHLATAPGVRMGSQNRSQSSQRRFDRKGLPAYNAYREVIR
jgi:pseudouridine-5'-phosphate glycosidase